MLQRNMNCASTPLQLGLEDLLGDLQHARRNGDLGRLAWLAYCEVRRWARMAGDLGLAEHSSEMITRCPHVSRQEFLAQMDGLIDELEQVRAHFPDSEQATSPRADGPADGGAVVGAAGDGLHPLAQQRLHQLAPAPRARAGG